MIVEFRSTLGSFTVDTDDPDHSTSDVLMPILRPTVIVRPSADAAPLYAWAPKGSPASVWLAWVLGAGVAALLFLAARALE